MYLGIVTMHDKSKLYLKEILVDTGQWAEQGVMYQSGNIRAINKTLHFQWCITYAHSII